MATDIERLIVALEARTRAFENAMARADTTANRRATAIERRFVALNRNLSNSFNSLGNRLGAALAGAFSINEIGKFLDSYTKVQNSLKVTGLTGDDLAKTYDQLYASAQRSAAPIESLATLYGRVAINQKELGVTSEQVVGLTDTVAKALKAQGSSAEESQGALLQLAQALGSGKIQAEEYNSLIDGMPVLLQAAAAGIQQAGGSVNKLTQLVKSGQISNKAFFDGIQAGSGVIEQKLANASETSSQSLTKLNNALTNSVGRFGTAANASAAFGNTVDRIVRYLDNVDFDHLAGEVAKIVEILETAGTALTTVLTKANQVAGIDVGKIADSIVPKDGESTYDYLYRAMYGTARAADEAAEASKKRLDLEQKIADLQNSNLKNSPLVKRDIALYQGQLNALNATKPFVQPQRPISHTPEFKRPMQGPNRPAFTADPIDITDDKYKPTDSASKSGKKRLDEYEREVKQITERTKAVNAATAAQSALNPLVDDYGYATERASAAQDLLSAAQAAGIAAGKELKDVQQLLSGNFDGLSPKAREQAEAMLQLANNQALAVANADRLSAAQDRLRDAIEGWRDFSKDASKGFIDDLVQGKGAVDALTNALGKLGDKLLGDALDGIFGQSGSSNWFTSLFSSGGGGSIAGARAGGGPVQKGKSYIVGEERPEVFVPDQNGTILPQVPTRAPTMPDLRGSLAGGNSFSLNFAPVIHAPNADSAGLEAVRRELAQMNADLPARVVDTVKNAQRRRILG